MSKVIVIGTGTMGIGIPAGFLAKRIQHSLMREALSLLEPGIATPDDIDTTVRYSFGFRFLDGWE